MVEKKVLKTKAQSDQLSDSDTPDEEVDPQLCRRRKNLRDDKRICAGYTVGVITYKGSQQSDSGKRPTPVTQNKEALER